ncbi:MAG: sugar ABC transporter substrate-binding protein, partial [Synergistaceae bacterium]|nr:sugar ABC transporter substrate-binding protein [Synergistaceae bacterium]
MKKFFALLIMSVTLITFANGAGAAETQYTVGATIFDMSNPFYANFIKGLNDGAAENGLKLLLRDGRDDPNTQVAVLQQFITEKVDIIVIVPGDAQAVVPGVVQANAAGIPVISANNKVGEGASIVTFVGADDYYFGQQQGKLLVEAVGNKGNVGYLMGKLGTSAQLLRRDGLMDFLKDYPDIKIVSEISEDWDSAKALASAQDMLSRHPAGEIDAILCQGPEAVPAARFALESGRKEVKWILGDYPQDVREAIRE